MHKKSPHLTHNFRLMSSVNIEICQELYNFVEIGRIKMGGGNYF